MQMPPDDHDDAHDDIDLSQLDLAHLDDDLNWDLETPPITLERWVSVAGVIVVIGGLLVLPHTEFYMQNQHTAWMLFSVCGAAIGAGLGFGRTLYLWAEETAERYAKRAALRPKSRKEYKPAPT